MCCADHAPGSEGGSLVNSSGKSSLPPISACSQCFTACKDAVYQAHTCCLQCKNVLLTKDWHKAKIADVGLSRVLGHTQTTSTMPMGTFAYAGIAQCTGSLFAGAGAYCFQHSHAPVTAAPELLLGDRAECTLQVDM